MTLIELNDYFNSFLQRENYVSDPSLNGIQIQNKEPVSKQIKKVAFAVDACEETALAAAEWGADVLFVHHGLFWGGCQTITGDFYKRISAFVNNDLALCAYHIPLDANNPYGNNYGLAAQVGLKKLKPFGSWRGMCIGVKGEFKTPVSIEELSNLVVRPGRSVPVVLPFGKKDIKTVGIISGGASEDVEDAVAEGLDAYITGEFTHEQYHFAKEMGINVIGAGHYETEIVGVNLVMHKLIKEKNLECKFLDFPTGL